MVVCYSPGMTHWICEQCDCDFQRSRSGARPVRFCSQICYHNWNRKNGNSGRFKKGHSTWNKNLKGIHLSPGSEFKKGHKNPNQVPVGTVRIRERNRPKNKNTKRAYIKIAEPNKWMERCHYVWEKRHGKIPKGMIVHHMDNNPLNDSLSNLALVTRGTHGRIHGKLRGGLDRSFL